MTGPALGAVGRVAGAFALASAGAYVAYLVLDDAVADHAITAWNLLIIPTALHLGFVLKRRGAAVSAASTAAGVMASLLWAFAYANPLLEPWWICLAAAWWLGIGWLLWPDRRRLGGFTVLLGVAALVDFVLTALHAPMPIYALGGFKIPLTIAWSVWVGLALVRDPALGASTPLRPASAGGGDRPVR